MNKYFTLLLAGIASQAVAADVGFGAAMSVNASTSANEKEMVGVTATAEYETALSEQSAAFASANIFVSPLSFQAGGPKNANFVVGGTFSQQGSPASAQIGLGLEVISPAAIFNYSTSYMFSYGPFSHTGLKADVSITDDVSMMLGVFNSTDQTESQPMDEDYMFGAQLGLYGQYINFLSGDDYTQFDFTGGFNISEKLFLGINATTTELAADASFSGVALYPQYTLSDSFSLGIRGEIFSETNGGAGALYSGALSGSSEDADNTSFTITGSYTKGNFILKPEFRIDTASANIYSKNATDFSDNLASFVVAAIYAF